MFRSGRQFAAGAVSAGLLFAAPPALGVEYLLRPLLDLRADYDDNLRLGAVDQFDAYGSQLRTGLNVRATGQAWRITSDMRLDTIRYNDSAFNTDNQYGSVTLAHFAPRRQLQFTATLDRDSLLGNEFDATGVIGFEASRVERVDLRPVSVWQLSERNSLTVGGAFSNVHYKNPLFNDYLNLSVNMSLSHQLNETLALEFSAAASEFSIEDKGYVQQREVAEPIVFVQGNQRIIQRFIETFDDFTSTTYSVEAGLRQALTERVGWNVLVGRRRVTSAESDGVLEQYDFVQDVIIFGGIVIPIGTPALTGVTFLSDAANSETSEGFIARAGIEYGGPRLQASAGYELSVSPAGLGFLLENDRYDGNLSWTLSEFSDLALRLNWTEATSITTGSNFARESQLASLTYSRRFSEHWRARTGVRYRTQQASFLRGRANSTAVFIELAYLAQAIQLSR